MPAFPASNPSTPRHKRVLRPLARLDALPPMPRGLIAGVPLGSVLLADDTAFLRAAEALSNELRASTKIG